MEISDIVRRNLEVLPFFDKDRDSIVVDERHGIIKIGYLTSQVGIPDGTTHFFMQIEELGEGKVAYLVQIELDENKKGLGLGEKMYKSIEDIARELGCNILRQHASGWTFRGEPRENYLIRRGYRKVPNCIEIEKVLQ